jgi:hypothetical protein
VGLAVRRGGAGRPTLVIPVVIIEQIANWMNWLVFFAEFVFMLSVVPNRKRWIKDNPLDVAIVVLTPPFLPAGLQALRVFRLLRLLRLIRVLQAVRRVFSPEGLQWALLVGTSPVQDGGSSGFWALEGGASLITAALTEGRVVRGSAEPSFASWPLEGVSGDQPRLESSYTGVASQAANSGSIPLGASSPNRKRAAARALRV